jgi:hypothetical protein
MPIPIDGSCDKVTMRTEALLKPLIRATVANGYVVPASRLLAALARPGALVEAA